MGRRLLRAFLFLALVYGLAGFLTSRIAWIGGVEDLPVAAGPPLLPEGHVLSGVVSIHTEHSHDATGSIDDVTRSARATGLGFVLVGDHPPGPERWTPAEYRDSVLIGYGLELDLTDVGRGLFFGMAAPPDPSILNAAGFSEAFLDTGTTGVVVHGRSPRERERWVLPETGPMHAWEVMDVSESARRALSNPWSVYHAVSLVLSAMTGRTGEALLRMDRLGFGAPAVAAFDSISMDGPVTALAGLNHHPKTVWRGRPLPDYLPFFETLINHVVLPGPPTGSALQDLRSVGDAIRDGRAYVSLGRSPAAEQFRLALIDDDGRETPMGSSAELTSGQRLVSSALHPAGGSTLFRVLRNGNEIGWSRGAYLDYPVEVPGVYRVEVYRYGHRVGPLHFDLRPWIFSNPIRIGEGAHRSTYLDGSGPEVGSQPVEVPEPAEVI